MRIKSRSTARTSRLFLHPAAKSLRANSNAFIAVALALLLIAPFLSVPAASGSGPNSKGTKSLPANLAAPQTSGRSTVYNPYWYSDKTTKATLEITNNDDSERTLTPVLLLRGVERVPLDPLTIRSGSTVRLSLNNALAGRLKNVRASGQTQRWGDGSRKRSLWGSALLEGETTLGISAWIISESRSESLSINSLFGGDATPMLSSMWWLPTPNAKVSYALQNVSASETTATTFLYFDNKVVYGRSVTLPGGSTRLVDLHDLLPGDISLTKTPEIGMVRFLVPPENGALLGRTMIVDEGVGFSVPLMVHPIRSHKSNILQMPGTPFGRPDRSMGFPRKTKFTTHLLLTNASETAIDITAALDGRDSTGNSVSWNAAIIKLAPWESRVIDLEKARKEGHSPIADGHVGVRLAHTGRAIDLLAEAVTVDQTMTFSFYDPFFDSGAPAPVLRAVSFNLGGTKNTLLVVKNPLNERNGFTYTLNYETEGVVSSYKSELVELAPYEVKVVDIKALRENGLKDAEGKRLPAGTTFGNASITASKTVLAAGDPTFDAVAGTCVSCTTGCGDDALCQTKEAQRREMCANCVAARVSACSSEWNACAAAAGLAAALVGAEAASGPCALLITPPAIAACAAAAAAAALALGIYACNQIYDACTLRAPSDCGCP